MRWILSLLCLFATPTFADSIFWSQNAALVGINEQWGLYGEYQPRWIRSLGDPQASIYRWAAVYRIHPKLRLGLGHAWVPQDRPSERNENRIFQQVEWFPESGSEWWTFFRGRVEQRWLERTDGFSHRLRLRYQVAWMQGVWGPYVWDEIFFNLNDQPRVVAGGFDQNRVSVGVRYKPDQMIAIELGYLLQTVRSTSDIQSNPGVLLNAGLTIW